MTRALVSVVAVCALVYLGAALRDFRLLGGALADGGSRVEPALADLRAAGRWNPDTTPELTRAFLLQATGRGAEAKALLLEVVAAEPDNLGAWRIVAEVAGEDDPALAARARAAQRRLDPLG